MQRFAIVLFALVALFATVVPSSASSLLHVKRETNADRFARGLPPLPPTRRATAKRQQNSQQPSAPTTGRIQVRDNGSGSQGGSPLGYVQNGQSGPHGLDINPGFSDLYVTFSSVQNSILCLDQQFNGGSYFGALAPGDIINAASTVALPLTNVYLGNVADEADIWWIDQTTGELTAYWTNPDSTTSLVYFAYNAAADSLVLLGDVVDFINGNPGWSQVVLFIV